MWYVHKKRIDYHIYPSTYTICVHIIIPKHILVQIRDDNYALISLSYVLTPYSTYVINGIPNMCGCKYTPYAI